MESVIEFCRAREAFQQVNRGIHEERVESTEATRALMGMLKDSMVRHNVECIEIPGTGKQSYVKMTVPTRKKKPLKTEDDIIDLTRGIGGAVVETSINEIPTKVTEFIASQLRQRTDVSTPPEPKISIVSKPVKSNTVRIASIPSEVRNLTEQFVQSCSTKKILTERIRPLKMAQKQNEKIALETFSEPISVRMRKDNRDVDMRVVKCKRKERHTSKALGIRLVLTMCRDSAERVCRQQEKVNHDFETEFREELLANVRTHLQSNAVNKPEYYLKVYKLTTN